MALEPQMVATAAADCETLMRVFLNADGLTRAARQMMIDGLPPATRVGTDKLHPLQGQFLAIAKETLDELKQDAERRQSEHEGKSESLTKQSEECKAAREAATTKVEEAKVLVQEKTKELKECEKVTDEIEKEHEEVLKQKVEEDERRAELDTSKAAVTSILEGPFQLLLEGKCDEDKSITSLEVFLKQIHAEPTLIAAAVRALVVKPDSRREFDVLTISCVKQALETQLNKVNAMIDDHQFKHRSVTAEQLGLWALLDQEKARVAAARASLVDVEISLMTAQELCNNAEKEVKAKSDAASQQLCEKVIVDDMIREIAGAHEAAARLAAFNYETVRLAAAPDASAPETATADAAGSVDVSMAATMG
mmetsp:Transcript_103652/g.200851  ORF Transcript_103652/g.200851 Transcript_103652/m.200851 type:complete len:366 (+) Transcript_103652:47-1144(+)